MTTTAAVCAYYDRDMYVSRNPILPIRARLVSSILRDTTNSRIVDLGCGDGTISRPLLRDGNRLTLVDCSRVMLDRAQANLGGAVELVEADILHYEPAEPADVVIAVGVLAHVSSPDTLIGQIAQMLRPGGVCVLEITDQSCLMGWLLGRYGDLRCREGWRANRLGRAQLTRLAASYDLLETPGTFRRYGLLAPGSGRLPYRIVSRFEEATIDSRLASQMLLSFRKPDRLTR